MENTPETTSPSTPAGEPEPAAPIIERATQEGELVGWRVRLPNDTMLVFADQAAMPGFRIGTEFTPNYGKTIEYATPVPAQAVPAPVAVSEGLSDEQLDEIAAKVFDSEHDSGDCVQDDLSRALDRRFARKAIAADRSLRSDGAAPLPLSDEQIDEYIKLSGMPEHVMLVSGAVYYPAPGVYRVVRHVLAEVTRRLGRGSDGAVQAEPVTRALEFAEYMAKDGEQVLDALNALHAIREEKDRHNDDEGDRAWEAIRADEDAAEENLSEQLRGLRSGIYEFRKRATKASTPGDAG